ncbi:hypothetical protein ENKO_111 [Klebsiella phage fENko-Kae01]|nr:hypothetical protein [Klebsiella phage fENko-Kae01]
MGEKSIVEQEIEVRIEEITIKIKELMDLADRNNVNFNLDIVNKDFYCEKYIEDDEWLNDYHGGNGGAWLSSSDFC